MKVKVELNNLRTAPRKVRLVADMVRGKKVQDAQAVLSFTVNKPAGSILKLLNSAIASAKHNLKLEESNLFVSEIFVDEGPKLKRWHPMSRGRAYPIIKRTSHITLVLSELNPTIAPVKNSTEVKANKPEIEKPAKKATVRKPRAVKTIKAKK